MTPLWIAILSFLGSSTGFAILSFILRSIRRHKDRFDADRERIISEKIVEKLQKDVFSYFASKEELLEDRLEIDNKIAAEINAINNKLDKIIKKQDKSETNRISTEILSAADDLRNGKRISQIRYHHLLESFEYYSKTLKKNGYIKEQMEYITERMKKTGVFYKKSDKDDDIR